ncbi:helix-turn-helix domain-containing protein [Chitinophaga silvisoli]|uniref:AraC family transcriptional regulator n=1 Tax=Chitinophaga silvisoli TaxID=2291814 RepID=A0A3E1P068_9BACT|nr:AraC family transcriptional regulator [Chitinophaga silvisoli]RFM33591.1 AraC family transcriptional regulator [Chitinophaga silvisoli]
MEEIIKIESIDTYNKLRGVSTRHPLITVVDLSKANRMPARTFNFGLYGVYLKDQMCGELRYGRRHYDYQEGTLVFIGPGQIVGMNTKERSFEANGWGLLFHPDLIKGTHLGRHIQEYSFFSYDVNEALHLSEEEREILLDGFRKIQAELGRAIDKHSKKLVTSGIELFLNYCNRFYDSQFITRDNVHKGVIEKFESLLQDYFTTEQGQLPSVSWCAGQLNLSANYFGDLVKKETGRSAQEYIQDKVIDMAKERVFDLEKSISEVAYELGFKYPAHFTRLFKQKVGVTPVEYRKLN